MKHTYMAAAVAISMLLVTPAFAATSATAAVNTYGVVGGVTTGNTITVQTTVPGSASSSAVVNTSVAMPSSTTTAVTGTATASGAGNVTTDQQVSNVDMSSQSVGLTYASRAKLFGFIPVTVPVHVAVSASGAVNVAYPWYAVFLSTNKAALQDKLQAMVQGTQSVNTGVSASADASLSASDQATLLQNIYTVLQSNFNTNAAAQTTAQSSY